MAEKKQDTAFKNWINAKVVEKYAVGLKKIAPNFDQKKFQSLSQKLPSLELKERVVLISQEIHSQIFTPETKDNFKTALEILLKAVKEQDIRGFELWPAAEYVRSYGTIDFSASFEAMYEITQRFTSEFAVRPFLNLDPEQSLSYLKKWVADPDVHIRRWISEGTRPRLPWGEKLPAFIKNPHRALELLEHLKFDPELYVRKSVSNHLNDIAKDHPDLVVKTLKRWKSLAPKSYEKEFSFIASRALRTLIKDGHEGALNLMGVVPNKNLKVLGLKLSPETVKFGSPLQIEFSIANVDTKPQSCIIDYKIYFMKANGDHSPKVFKLKKVSLKPSEKLKIQKRHPFKKITTRKYYNGEHMIQILVNGQASKKVRFMLRGT